MEVLLEKFFLYYRLSRIASLGVVVTKTARKKKVDRKLDSGWNLFLFFSSFLFFCFCLFVFSFSFLFINLLIFSYFSSVLFLYTGGLNFF